MILRNLHFFASGFVYLFLLAMPTQPALAEGGAGRIIAAVDNGRCVQQAITPEQCKQKRDKALERGCISQEEFDALVRFNAFPSCDWDLPKESMLLSWCPCGCVHPDTLLAVSESSSGEPNHIRAEDLATEHKKHNLVTLAAGSDLESQDLRFGSHAVVLSTVGPQKKGLVQISLLDGRVLKVTPTHPVVLASGQIKPAKELTTEDLVLGQSGQALDIVAVKTVPYSGLVYNFASSAGLDDPWGHVVFGQGVAIGDLTLEAMLQYQRSSVELRK